MREEIGHTGYLTNDGVLTTIPPRALLALRVTLGLFLLQSGVEKFVMSQSNVAIWDDLHSPGKIPGCLRDLVAFRSRRYLGHGPAGGAKPS